MSDLAEAISFEDPTDVFYNNIDYIKKQSEKDKSSKGNQLIKKNQSSPKDNLNEGQKRKYKRETDFEISKPKSMKRCRKEDKSTLNISTVEASLQRIGLKQLFADPDGNCFFHSLSVEGLDRHKFLRKQCTAIMQRNSSLFNCLFNAQHRENYFIGEQSVEERCLNMSKDKTWAGFPERFAAALFLKKNIYELYISPSSQHWNIYVGDSKLESLHQNENEPIFITYNVEERHFNPMKPIQSALGEIKVSNVYFLVKDSSPDSEGILLCMTPSDLIPTHNLYQEEAAQHNSTYPVGLRNEGMNICYFNSIVQSLRVFGELFGALESDLQSIPNQESILKSFVTLLKKMKDYSSPDTLEIASRDVLFKMQECFPNKYDFQNQHDPQEFFTDIFMIINQELKQDEDILHHNFSTLLETVTSYEKYNKSQTTRLFTSYLKTNRLMHSSCTKTSFTAMSFLPLAIPENISRHLSVEALVEKFLGEEKRQILSCSECNFPYPDVEEKHTLEKYPRILILKLLRYECNNGSISFNCLIITGTDLMD